MARGLGAALVEVKMAAIVGKRYVAPSGAEVIVTKGGPGALSDAGTLLVPRESAGSATPDLGRTEPVIALGKRYRSTDGAVELLVLRAGVCDLHYDGQPMQLLQTKALPSAD